MKINLNSLRLILLVITAILSTYAGDSRPKPLSWKWKRSEIKVMKKQISQVKEVKPGVFEYESENWKVRTYHTPRFTIQVATYMEMFSDIFQKAFLFKADYAFKDKPLMIIFPNKRRYLNDFKAIPGSGGMFRYWWRSNGKGKITSYKLELGTYYSSDKDEPDFDSKAKLRVIQHEATHCLLQKIYGHKKVPDWLTEGAATYYEAWEIRRKISDSGNSPKDIKARRVRRAHTFRPRVLSYLTQQKGGVLPRLDYLVSLTSAKEWNIDDMGDETSYHYAIAESFIDYLMNSKKRRPFLFKIMQRLYDGEKPIITPQEQLEHEKAWLKFISKTWKVKFASHLIDNRVKELKKRINESQNGK